MNEVPVMWTFHVSCESVRAARLVNELATAYGYASLVGEAVFRMHEEDGHIIADKAFLIKVHAPPSKFEALKAIMVQFANNHGQRWLVIEVGSAQLVDTGHRDRIISHTFREEDITL